MSTPSLQTLRSRHPRFIYDSYQAEVVSSGLKSSGLKSTGLKLEHFFKIEPDIELKTEAIIEGVTDEQWLSLPKNLRNEWVFHLGLAELPSYWKASASPKIVIEAGHLNQEQIAWWHKLLIKGMGEYFYVNQIDFTAKDFVTWKVDYKEKNRQKNDLEATLIPSDRQASDQQSNSRQANNSQPIAKYLLPIGGGKDSAAAACFLRQQAIPFSTFLLNPTPAMKQVSAILKPTATLTAQRTIDPRLLALNKQGYLNGHVPFSAYLAYLSRLTSLIFGYQSVVIANERSSNQGNVNYLDHEINHQYSKSFEFEQDFENYLQKNHLVPAATQATKSQAAKNQTTKTAQPLTTQATATQATKSQTTENQTSATQEPSYFSLLRPLYELQISQLLVSCPQFDQLSTVFRSCNRGQKNNAWCGRCPKCLFTFVSLFPFISEEKLGEKMKKIFGSNLLEDESLLPVAQALLGQSKNKPFECVGTYQETRAAFALCQKKYEVKNEKLPILLKKLALSPQNKKLNPQKILQAWNEQHQLSTKLVSKLKKRVENLEHQSNF